LAWIQRLTNAFGSPNLCISMELCAWGRYLATRYTFGASVPAAYMPDLEHAGCILYWGYNPNLARLSHAIATVDALRRGTRLIVVDPRRIGSANRADVWLQVRPGTDTALALGIAGVMIDRGWYDREFVRDWTNGPLLWFAIGVCRAPGRDTPGQWTYVFMTTPVETIQRVRALWQGMRLRVNGHAILLRPVDPEVESRSPP
jgi:anaerobic selenocysteine-containing dehydrogenase